METTVNVQDIINGLPEDRREKIIADAARITNESLKQGAQENLESYYVERDRLAEEITTLQRDLDTAKLNLKKLNKKNRSLLKLTGAHKTYDLLFYELILAYPGVTLSEIRERILLDPQYAQIANAIDYIRSTVSILKSSNCVEIIEGKHFVKGYFTKMSASGYIDWISLALKNGPKTTKEIRAYILERYKITLAPIKMSPAFSRLLSNNTIASSRTHKHQKDVVYTWIGEK